MASALGRPLIAQKLVEIAGIEQTTTVAHGGGGQRQRPRASTSPIRALEPAAEGPRAGARLGHDAARGDRIRGDTRHRRAGRRRDAATAPTRTSGARRRVRRHSTTVERAAGGALHADQAGVGLPRRAGLRRGRVRARRADRRQRRRDAAPRSHRQPRHDRRRPRRRPLDVVETASAARLREIGEAPAAVVLHAAHAELQKTGDAQRRAIGSPRRSAASTPI